MKRRYKILLTVILLIVFIISPFFQFASSVIVMSVYSLSEANNSLLKKENIEIDMPGGWSTLKKDWYPFVMTFNNDEGFSDFSGKDVELSILYNFGAFEYLKGASTYYNLKSPYFDSFYGAYVVKEKGFAFGYEEDGTPDFDEMALVPQYDLNVLVLQSIGCQHPRFSFQMDQTYKEAYFLGYNDWNVIEGTISTQSPMHRVTEKYQAYIQYGKPPETRGASTDFEDIEVKGKIYARYFPEKKCSIFLYIIAPNDEAVIKCDKDFLQKTEIKLN
ncbi:MAG: hypothetical protein H7X94_04745 [Vallitaleaceae bacterium]|nr:hypothetical protein [Vallitaleaceae bacterium]